MSPPEHRIVYMSRARVLFSDEQLALLGDAAAVANRLHGITGYLLYDGLRFLQAIEGPRQATATLMDNIRWDERHDTIEAFADEATNCRTFGRWGLAYQRVEAGACSRAFKMAVSRGVAHVHDANLRAIFIGFAALATTRR